MGSLNWSGKQQLNELSRIIHVNSGKTMLTRGTISRMIFTRLRMPLETLSSRLNTTRIHHQEKGIKKGHPVIQEIQQCVSRYFNGYLHACS